MFDHVKKFEFTKLVGEISFGQHCICDDYSYVYSTGKIKIGNFVHICCFSSVIGQDIEIEDFSAISQGVRLIGSTDDFVNGGFGNSTLSLVTDKHDEYRNTKRGFIKVGKFCIIGANSVVLPNVSIAEGVTVGAGSIVTRSLDIPYGVYINNELVKYRDMAKVKKNYEKFINETSYE
jgi:galactoside O-acetyltransferase